MHSLNPSIEETKLCELKADLYSEFQVSPISLVRPWLKKHK